MSRPTATGARSQQDSRPPADTRLSPGPLRRLAGTVGLIALIPTSWMLAMGSITPFDAAARAAATLLAVVVLARLAGLWLSFTARAFERAQAVEPGAGASAAGVARAARPAQPARRRTDTPVAGRS